MELKKVIESRRAYRALKPSPISDHVVKYIAWASQLAPSCFNNQPCKYVFIRSREKLQEFFPALSRGNEWAYDCSMIIAAFSKKEDDCVIYKREYHLFDCGLSVANVILAATDMGYVAHPIAGYSERKAKKILNIPVEMTLIALVIVGEHDKEKIEALQGQQKEEEFVRPKRKEVSEYIFIDEYKDIEEEEEQ